MSSKPIGYASALAGLLLASPVVAQSYWPGSQPGGTYGQPRYDQGYDYGRPPSQYGRPQSQYGQDDDANDYFYPGTAQRPQRRANRLPNTAALPSDADPAYSTAAGTDQDVDFGSSTRRSVLDPTGQGAGTITINTARRKLYLSTGNGQAVEYGIGVGRQGFSWKGEALVGRKAYWPGWTPPKEMVARRPDLPSHMEGGLSNPLGARALYLFQGNKDTLFRIHGTNEPDTIGKAVSSGCIRMLNADVIDLYGRVSTGAHVVVL